MTVSTNSRYQKEIIAQYLDETADSMFKLPYMLHDFGFRGSTSVEVRQINVRLLEMYAFTYLFNS